MARRGSSPPREPVSRSAVPDSYQQLPPLSTSIKSSRYFTINFSFLELSPRTHKSEGQFPCQWNQKASHIRVLEKESPSKSMLIARAQVQKSRRGTGRIRRSDSATKVFSKRTDVTETLKDNSTLGECVFHSRLWFRLEGCAIQL